jgi:hypothetical protein
MATTMYVSRVDTHNRKCMFDMGGNKVLDVDVFFDMMMVM